METELPVDPQDLTTMCRVYGMHLKTNNSSLSRNLPHYCRGYEFTHLCQWIMVNSTCRRFRDLGKVAFFSQKRFLLGPAEVKKLFCIGNRFWRLSPADTCLARQHIRHVVMPFSIEDALTGSPGCCFMFRKLSTIDLLYTRRRGYGQMGYLCRLFELAGNIPINDDLRARLSNIYGRKQLL